MTRLDLKDSEFDSYYKQYIVKLEKQLNLREAFQSGRDTVIRFFESIPKNKHDYQYATNKWSLKEVLQHLIDTERIFMYRCFRIARADKANLLGFDQDLIMRNSHTKEKTMEALTNEFYTMRQSSIVLLNSLSDTDLKEIGNSNGHPMSARAAAFTIVGHDIWHMNIIKERYL